MPNFPQVDAYGRERTAYAVECFITTNIPGLGEHGLVYLSEEEYLAQINVPNKTWICPLCGMDADWNYENYKEVLSDLPTK